MGQGFVVGVDGGASKTLAVVGDLTGRILGVGRAGPSNHQTVGLGEAVAQVAAAVDAAKADVGLGAHDLELAMLCLAGADLPEDYALLQEAMSQVGLARQVVVKNDTLAALRSGLSRPWGVVVVCGTGFNAAGRGKDGREIVTAGLGFISGDWGGGGEISQEIIRRAMRAWDGRGPDTALLPMTLRHFGVATAAEAIAALYHNRIPTAKVLELVPLLFEAAYAGDEVACVLVREVGTEVGVTARTLLRRLGLADEEVEVVLAGSVFKAKGPLLRDTVTQVVHEVAPRAVTVLPRVEPVVGAFLLAVEAMDGDPRHLAPTLPAGLRNPRGDGSAAGEGG